MFIGQAVLCVVGCAVVGYIVLRLFLKVRKLERRDVRQEKQIRSERLRVAKLNRELDDLEEGSTGWSETGAEAQEFKILCRQAKDDELQTAHADCVRFVEGGTRPVSRVEEVRLLKAAGAFVKGKGKSGTPKPRGNRGSGNQSPNGDQSQQGQAAEGAAGGGWDEHRRRR